MKRKTGYNHSNYKKQNWYMLFFITYCSLTYFQTYLLPNVFIFLENTHSNDLNELKVGFYERHYLKFIHSEKATKF